MKVKSLHPLNQVGQEPLSISDIRSLSAIFVKLLNVLAQLKKQHKLASHIKHPQIPKILLQIIGDISYK